MSSQVYHKKLLYYRSKKKYIVLTQNYVNPETSIKSMYII